MSEKEFRDVMAKAPDDVTRLRIIEEKFQWFGMITPRESALAIYYIANTLAMLLSKIEVKKP